MENIKRKNQQWVLAISFCILLLVLFISCQKTEDATIKIQSALPEDSLKEESASGNYPYRRLSTYGFFQGDLNALDPTEGVIFYKPASSLFTDNAFKSRFVFIPEGNNAEIEAEELNLPLGTILIKNFYYPTDFRNPDGDRKIIETRLMIHEEKGWQAYPYVWNESQTEAVLRVVGGEFEVRYIDLQGENQIINYLVPNKNQCKSCHNKNEAMAPIGVQIKHLNNEVDYGHIQANQLKYWSDRRKLLGWDEAKAYPTLVNYEDQSQELNDRAMAYLDINCAHCHSAAGPASTSGLFLTYDQQDPMKLGINKTPVAAGSGAGSFTYDIVPGKPEESILIHRMNSTQVGVAMPEIGRTTVDKKGVELIKAWIAELE
ncbi:SO2930 family diheme c-type cytochrome [Algoriphagus litoralis]|uniref:SO2930 family diheme c-type cytochrome n=1 Tax=Algoriphagus litoralis TaxID=2202829 RepID=UPI000DBAC728|nr:SO2930 family diheme c-type cytochrome [Algoriphagus litoralis]